jgi:hypothetical protein
LLVACFLLWWWICKFQWEHSKVNLQRRMLSCAPHGLLALFSWVLCIKVVLNMISHNFVILYSILKCLLGLLWFNVSIFLKY